MNEGEKNLLMLCSVEHARHGRYDDALEVITRILDEDPGDYQALFHKVFTLRMSGRKDEARELIISLLDLMPDSAGVHFQAGQIFSDCGDLQRAREHFLRVTDLQPFSADAWIELGALSVRLGRPEDANEIYRNGSVFAPDDASIWIQLGISYISGKDPDEALRCFDHALDLETGNEQALCCKARIYEGRNDRENELACYDEIIRWHPDSLFAWLKKGLILMLGGEYDRSVACFTIASGLDNPGHMPFMLKGLVFSLLNRTEEAIPWFEEAHSRKPEDPDILIYLARSLAAAGRHEKAVETFDQILVLHPGNQEAMEGKVRSLYHLKRWGEVLPICMESRSRFPKEPVYYLLEARVRGWHTGEGELARSIILEGLSIIPSDEHLISLLSDLYVHQGLPESAIGILSSELGGHPQSYDLLFRLAALLAQKGDYASASSYYDQILKGHPNDIPTLYLAGETCELMGDPDHALERYNSAVAVNPADPRGWIGRSRILCETGNPHESRRSAIQAASLSDLEEAWQCRGKAEIAAGMLEEARKTFTYITLNWPDHSQGWKYLGDVMHLLHEDKAACISYTRALEINPEDLDALEAKTRILTRMEEIKASY